VNKHGVYPLDADPLFLLFAALFASCMLVACTQASDIIIIIEQRREEELKSHAVIFAIIFFRFSRI
jgi:hypothetical protein